MTHFQESAVRNSVTAQPDRSGIPYWQNDQFSTLLEVQRQAGMAQPAVQHDHTLDPVFSNPGTLQVGVNSTMMGLNMSANGYRPVEYSEYHEFAQVQQELSQALEEFDQPPSVALHMPKRVTVKTPTGPRSMRRPGLAGAAALVNGQYCCQWTGHGIACGHKFTDAKSLNDHIRAHHVRGAATFLCQWSGCDKSGFPTANKLVRHVHSHTGYKPYPCTHCPQAFVTKDQLDKHLTTHTGAKDFVCTWPGCGRSFAVKHALDGHTNSVHLKAKKHVCPHCSQAFDDSSNLSKHKKQVHNKDTGIHCPARHTDGCSYVDSRKDKMKDHCEKEKHGLEVIHDAHAWNLWVQRFKTCSKKHTARRHCHHIVSTAPNLQFSNASSAVSCPISMRTPVVDCSKQGCNLPACVPCPSFCPDLQNVGHLHHHTEFPHFDDEPCDPCDVHCNPCSAHCDPCEDDCDSGHCNDDHCELADEQQCDNEQICTLPHCRSGTSTPSSQPATPREMPSDSYFPYNPLQGVDGDLFQDQGQPFQFGAGRLPEYMFTG
jgi:zinc finger protein ZIC 1